MMELKIQPQIRQYSFRYMAHCSTTVNAKFFSTLLAIYGLYCSFWWMVNQ